jgi:hypothetical protein
VVGIEEEVKALRLIGLWEFKVYEAEDGAILTKWHVYEDSDEEQDDHGVVPGTLWDALQTACDAIGIICPLVPDPDLMVLGGHGEEER